MDSQLIEAAESYAALYFSVPQLAIILQLPQEEIRLAMDDSSSPLGQAIHRGRLLRMAQVREAVFKLALQGSGPAQAEAMRIMQTAL